MNRLTTGATVTLTKSDWTRPATFTVVRVYQNGNASLRSAEIGNRDRIKITPANCAEFQILAIHQRQPDRPMRRHANPLPVLFLFALYILAESLPGLLFP
jgi:hypothetical protein